MGFNSTLASLYMHQKIKPVVSKFKWVRATYNYVSLVGLYLAASYIHQSILQNVVVCL